MDYPKTLFFYATPTFLAQLVYVKTDDLALEPNSNPVWHVTLLAKSPMILFLKQAQYPLSLVVPTLLAHVL